MIFIIKNKLKKTKMIKHQVNRLIVVTRRDLTPGQQMSQMGHSLSQYHLDYPESARQWNNGYLISLSIDSEQKLQHLLIKLQDLGIKVSYFTEPDFGDQLTSICFIETDKTYRITSSLPNSLKEYKL